MKTWLAIVAAGASAFIATSASGADPIDKQIAAYLSRPPEQPMTVSQDPDDPVWIPDALRQNIRYGFEKRMALTGHGVLFDIEGRRVKLEVAEARALQAELLKALRAEKIDAKAVPADVGQQLAAFVKDMDAFAAKAQSDKSRDAADVNADAMRHLTVRALAYRLDDRRRSAYLWRDTYLWNQILWDRRFQYITEYVFSAERLREILRRILSRTTYMNDCAAAGVPVPNDFSASSGGGGWTHQGDLTTNMLSPGAAAHVWTWASPTVEGACIALPRDGGLSGMICQGAATGNACFYDNLDRTTGNRIDWTTQTLVINQLQDGTMLSENCTGCHKGNNVYLVAPMDATWCRLLRGGRPGVTCAAPSGLNAANLNLQVTGVVDPLPQPGTSVVHSRYRPMSGTPSRPGWANTAVTSPGCGGSCHLNSVGGFTTPSMPPACGTDCYWRP